MDSITKSINRGDEQLALREFDSQWEQYPWPKRYFTLLFPLAAGCLELKYPSPHSIKYHHALGVICDNLPGDSTKFLLKRYIQYLCRRARFVPFSKPLEINGDLGAEPSLTGLNKSLQDAAFFKALYYLLRLREEKGFASAALELVKICSRSVDNLGHNYTCAHSIMAGGLVAERVNEGFALAALLDYTMKLADLQPTEFRRPSESFEKLLSKAVCAPGLLGHHLIFAHRIERFADTLGERWRFHLEFFLEKNLQDAEGKYTLQYISSMIEDDLTDGNYLVSLTNGLLELDLKRAFTSIYHHLESEDSQSGLFEVMIIIMACVNREEAHFYTYPLAVKELSERFPGKSVQLYCGWADFIVDFAQKDGWIEKHRERLEMLL